MKLIITLNVDNFDSYCDAVLEELTTAALEHESITVTSGGGSFEAEILSVIEQPAIGRPPNDPQQSTIFDILDGVDA